MMKALKVLAVILMAGMLVVLAAVPALAGAQEIKPMACWTNCSGTGGELQS